MEWLCLIWEGFFVMINDVVYRKGWNKRNYKKCYFMKYMVEIDIEVFFCYII